MNANLSSYADKVNLGFSVFDHIFYSDSSLAFGNILSADRIRAMFADSDALFGYGENNFWNTGVLCGHLSVRYCRTANKVRVMRQ